VGESIKMVIQRNPDRRRGDVYVLNDPCHAGTHLPDITVVTPAFPRPPPPPARPAASRHDGALSRL
jgi:5-oxoprolinase (ATP-hydrolysing)